jgi:hypothetical protein
VPRAKKRWHITQRAWANVAPYRSTIVQPPLSVRIAKPCLRRVGGSRRVSRRRLWWTSSEERVLGHGHPARASRAHRLWRANHRWSPLPIRLEILVPIATHATAICLRKPQPTETPSSRSSKTGPMVTRGAPGLPSGARPHASSASRPRQSSSVLVGSLLWLSGWRRVVPAPRLGCLAVQQ